ncbi:MAG: amidohydrolase, partial [Lachnospiraceae bacterium]|nr:amidohydrolase [Lachnospiraceae bacterium]
MNTRFYNAKILTLDENDKFDIIAGELWVKGNEIIYIGDGSDVANVCTGDDIIVWDIEKDCYGNLLMPGFKNAHTHTP